MRLGTYTTISIRWTNMTFKTVPVHCSSIPNVNASETENDVAAVASGRGSDDRAGGRVWFGLDSHCGVSRAGAIEIAMIFVLET